MAYEKPTVTKIAETDPSGMEFMAADLSVCAIIVVAVIVIVVIVAVWSGVSLPGNQIGPNGTIDYSELWMPNG